MRVECDARVLCSVRFLLAGLILLLTDAVGVVVLLVVVAIDVGIVVEKMISRARERSRARGAHRGAAEARGCTRHR